MYFFSFLHLKERLVHENAKGAKKNEIGRGKKEKKLLLLSRCLSCLFFFQLEKEIKPFPQNGAPLVAVRMIWSSAEPTTTNRKKPSMIGPTLELVPFFFCGREVVGGG